MTYPTPHYTYWSFTKDWRKNKWKVYYFLMIANLCFNAIYKLRSIDESLGIVMEFFAHLEPMTEEEYHKELEKSKKGKKR